MKKIRAAVVGVGYLGRFHAQKYAALPECELTAVVDIDTEVAARVAAELGTRALSDYRELCGQVDAVSVVTPTDSHAEIATALLRTGAHVLVEKPIAQSVQQAQQLIDAARENGLVLQVGHLERFNPAILAAEPLLARARFIECHRLAPFKERGTEVNVVLDLMIHDIDLVQMIIGSPVATLDAVGTPVFSGEIDIANVRLNFENGCVANVTASRVSLKTERKLRVFHDGGYLSIDLQQKILTVIRKRALPATAGELPVQIEEQSFAQGDALLAEIEAFLAAVRGERAVLVSGEDGQRALRTAIAITERMRVPAPETLHA
ncbi:MAG: Gfo/Idh/MocA family oxidoreductase [Steroidobacteraceae bacterium]|jgi:predicted dehydrogenase